ncbi:hypothetical protein EZS27_035372 [termite gut metagenome]|uniref:Uncharacterized protein n=1 Tax=termite gut metagenome TaxID=433724 RepID=A0A5J4PZ17_9ZZZZ
MIQRIIKKILNYFIRQYGILYRKLRSIEFGARSVLDMRNRDASIDDITKKQRNEIFPFIKSQLSDEK